LQYGQTKIWFDFPLGIHIEDEKSLIFKSMHGEKLIVQMHEGYTIVSPVKASRTHFDYE
jgi:hypothetical protein